MSGQPSRNRHPLRRFILWQVGCFAVLVAFVWITEAFDPGLHHNSISTSPDWAKAGCLTAVITAVGIVTILPLAMSRRGMISGSVNICSYCHKVQVNENAWEQVETFFADRTFATFSHGVCPHCCDRVMTDYRNGKKNAGARETVVPVGV